MTLANAKSSIAEFAIKSTFTKSLLAAAATAALLFAVPPKSDAQVAFGVQFGTPVAIVPAYAYGYGYSYDQRRAYIEHEEWLRAHRYDRDSLYDRDRYDHDRYYSDRDRRDHDRDDHGRYDRDRR